MATDEVFDGGFVVAGAGEKDAGSHGFGAVETFRVVVRDGGDCISQCKDLVERFCCVAAAAYAHSRTVSTAEVRRFDFRYAPAVELSAVTELPIAVGKVGKMPFGGLRQKLRPCFGLQKRLTDGEREHGVVREGAFGRKELKRLAEVIGVFELRADDVADNGSEHCCLPDKVNFRSRPD